MTTTLEEDEKTGGFEQSPDASESETAGPVVNEKVLLRKVDAYLLPAVG
jgi:hypothetical protein